MSKIIIFTDLDGTLLDYASYSFAKAETALAYIKQRSIPLIICSSKTKKEILVYREKLGIKEPFISENGGGIFDTGSHLAPVSETLDLGKGHVESLMPLIGRVLERAEIGYPDLDRIAESLTLKKKASGPRRSARSCCRS